MTAMTVSSAARHSAVVGEVLAHKRTAHQSRAAPAHRVRVRQRAGASARHLSSLVLARDEEHETSVGTGECRRANSNTRDLGLGARRRVIVRCVLEDITTVAG